jgi:hypothetical protein
MGVLSEIGSEFGMTYLAKFGGYGQRSRTPLQMCEDPLFLNNFILQICLNYQLNDKNTIKLHTFTSICGTKVFGPTGFTTSLG